ncbi:MAG TPA: IclR family transcriptional regulator C-terminal domain-containing protein [Steroidobacteraceae bacterium]|nr:IclR family transcriptional regulator C-terminal domain-containing protein [Steroidobacteraceae bacterium]
MRDPLLNQSVEKAFAVLGAFSAERRVQGLAEIASTAGMTVGSAQRCVHTLVQLGYLQRIARLHGWALTSKTLDIGYPYLAGHKVLEQATIHLADLNHATGESVSLSEPQGLEMVFIARFPSHKRFFIHMSVGRRLPMYCTAAGRAYLSALPEKEVTEILQRSELRKLTPHTLHDVGQILEIVAAARELGYAWASQECYLGDLTLAAPILGEGGRPVAAVNLSGPTSRWTMPELRERVAPLLLETARAASGRAGTSHGG